jgi:hypothetical protein
MAQAAAGVSPFKLMPAGLYRIDMTSTIAHPSGELRTDHETNGATGDETVHWVGKDATHTRTYKGEGPVTQCVQPFPAGAVAPVPGIQGACAQQSTQETKDGFVHVAQCPDGRVTLTAHRRDDDTWDMDYTYDSTPNPNGPDLSGLRAAMARAAKTGTAEERARAREALKQMPTQQQLAAQRQATMETMKQARAKAKNAEEAAALDKAIASFSQYGGGFPLHVTNHQRWTRIAHTCAAR